MLIQAMEGQGAEALLATIERRVTYLEWRAKGLEIEVRSKPRKTETPWQLAMMGASLWLDAAESAASIGAWVRSRMFLRHAARRLLNLGLPAGAALALGCLRHDGTDHVRALTLVRAWLEQPNRGDEPRRQAEGEDDEASDLPARDHPQQWAYLALAADAGREAESAAAMARERIANRAASAFGRSALPIDAVSIVLASPTLSAGPARGSENEIEAVAKALARMHHGLLWARHNRYLWNRALSPAPLFDLDVALLVLALLRRSNDGMADLESRVIRHTARADADFAKAFVRSAAALGRPALRH